MDFPNFTMDGSNESSGGSRGFIDLAQPGGHGPFFESLLKQLMTNAPRGVTQFTKAPWNFND